ncbi:zinc metallopeptidase [bacterium]|nr:zinc metallopeptidase [bacterium]
MLYLIITILLLAFAYWPQWWVKRTINAHNSTLTTLSGTGGELAQHLIERFSLKTTVELCEEGQDHFDPGSNTVRLSPRFFHSASIAAVAVAAHEVGHALQYSRGERIFTLREKYLPIGMGLRKVGIGMLMLVPIIGLVLKAPILIGLYIAICLLLQLAGVACYLIVLPEEWDASFNKALPILREGYISPDELMGAEKVLKAAALTYAAAALADMVNLGRWWLVLRR